MTDRLRKRLAEIRVRADAATPGPWEVGEDGAGTRCIFWKSPWHGKEDFIKFFWPGHPPEATKQIEDWWEGAEKLVAHSRTDIPLLLDVVEKLVGALERIAEPYDESWPQATCVVALRHDEHEALSAIAEAEKILEGK